MFSIYFILLLCIALSAIILAISYKLKRNLYQDLLFFILLIITGLAFLNEPFSGGSDFYTIIGDIFVFTGLLSGILSYFLKR